MLKEVPTLPKDWAQTLRVSLPLLKIKGIRKISNQGIALQQLVAVDSPEELASCSTTYFIEQIK